MRGAVAFLPVSPAAFAASLDRLLAGHESDPVVLTEAASSYRRVARVASRYTRAVERSLETASPPPLPETGPLWRRIKARLDRMEYRIEPWLARLADHVDPELHLHGRPLFVTEGSADAVAQAVDEYLAAGGAATAESVALAQLARLDAEAARRIAALDGPAAGTDLPYRSRFNSGLRRLVELSRRVRRSGSDAGTGAGAWRPADDGAVAAELAWRAVSLFGRTVPVWIARDLDGLATVCRMAGTPVPTVLVPPFELFDAALEAIPALRPALRVEMERPRDVGAWAAPADVPQLLQFLHDRGARLIQAAARHGEGEACATLLHKIRECAAFAARHRLGYLEAAGVDRVEDDWNPESGDEGVRLAALLGDDLLTRADETVPVG
jgi:hypothetical protein